MSARLLCGWVRKWAASRNASSVCEGRESCERLLAHLMRAAGRDEDGLVRVLLEGPGLDARVCLQPRQMGFRQHHPLHPTHTHTHVCAVPHLS